MKPKTRQTVLLAAIAFGAVWNSMCLAGALPVDKWPLSTGIVCMGSLLNQIPLLFQSTAPKEEKTASTKASRQKDRIFLAVLLGLAVIWVITMVACFFDS